MEFSIDLSQVEGFEDETILSKTEEDLRGIAEKHKNRLETMGPINPMAMEAYEIESMIKEALPDAQVRIEDLRGDGDHYAAIVVSEQFRGKTRVVQHQMVYSALKGKMGGDLHALALQTSAPD